jgi:hypothetical protein
VNNNRSPGICNCCKAPVATGCGVIRYWNGAARRHAPKYAKKSPYGIIHALLCATCDDIRLGKLLTTAI